MANLFRAEWDKIAGNRWAAGFLIWVFPVGVFVFGAIYLVMVLLVDDVRRQIADWQWTTSFLGTWSFPNNFLGRLFIVAFTAIIFAGEYQYGTWKNLVPRRRRVVLILNKYLVLAAFVLVAFVTMSLIAGFGGGILVRTAGGDYGPVLTGEVLGDFAREYSLQMFLTFAGTLIAVGLASLAAMFTRSMLASLMAAAVVLIAEAASIVFVFLLDQWLDWHWLYDLYKLTPGYNLDNILAWVMRGTGALPPIVQFNGIPFDPNSLGVSVLILLGWIVALVTLTTWLFSRQDITS
jgi:ABC-type transport system involved in multi-copper enzyme maturation permease subunit